MNTLRGALLVAATVLLLGAARASEAAPITFMFEGLITEVGAGSPTSLGDVFTGSFSYDPDALPTRTDTGEALFDDNLLGLEFTIAGWHGSAAAPARIGPPVAPLGLIYDAPLTSDVLFVQDLFDTATTDMGHSLRVVTLLLGDSSRAVFSSPRLPEAIDLAAFDRNSVSIQWNASGVGVDTGVLTRVERVEVVPEPSTLGLMCLAGLAGALRRRRRITRHHAR